MALIRIILTICLLALVHAKVAGHTEEVTSKLEQYIEEKKSQINPRYRLQYHVMPPVGWMNDPNGFSYYNGEYHLFYQFYPYDSKWGPMHWGHSSSPDLVNWKELPTALIPEKEQCFSGSGVLDPEEGVVVLMYTGHEAIDQEPYYNESQYLAYSEDGINFYKYKGNPVLPASPDGSPDFRDPKVWRHEDHWYVVLGSKTTDLGGRVLLYRSKNLKNWDFLSVIGESNGELGYMWECPDFFELDGKFVLMMSPQGMQAQGDRYKNTFQTGYIIGDFDYETFEFRPEVGFQELDFGHDFYATQTMERDGKRYVVAWFGMWEVPHPEDVDGWAGAMTIIRELKIIENRILMKPVDSMLDIRDENVFNGNLEHNHVIELNKTAEIILEGDLNQKIEILFQGIHGGEGALLKWDPEENKVVVDRGSGDVRQVDWSPIGSRFWRIFLDASSLEVFCGEGEVVFSSRVYPDGPWTVTNMSLQPLYFEVYSLKRSVPEP